jgi:hypothetical protein
MPFERYEILLPLNYNDGTPIEPEKFQETRRELVEQFGALPWTLQRSQDYGCPVGVSIVMNYCALWLIQKRQLILTPSFGTLKSG